MKRIIIFIFMFVVLLGNVVYAEEIEFPEYPWYLPPFPENENGYNYFIVRSEGMIYLVYDDKYHKHEPDYQKTNLRKDENGDYICIWKPRSYSYIYYYVYNEEENIWYERSKYSPMNLYGYEILYSNYEMIDSKTGEVFFPLPPPPTLEEITGESVEKIPGVMAGTMRTMCRAGFGILLGIVLVRSLKALYQYF